jgi:hypothetical protein
MISSFRRVFSLYLLSFFTFSDSALGHCEAGHHQCRILAGTGRTWCKADTETCQGRPDLRCSCDGDREVRARKQVNPFASAQLRNHEICTRLVGRGSWCKSNFRCKDGDAIFCGVFIRTTSDPVEDRPVDAKLGDGTNRRSKEVDSAKSTRSPSKAQSVSGTTTTRVPTSQSRRLTDDSTDAIVRKGGVGKVPTTEPSAVLTSTMLIEELKHFEVVRTTLSPSQTTVSTPSPPISRNHNICKAWSTSSWCRKDGVCQNFPHVRCSGSAAGISATPRPAGTTVIPASRVSPPGTVQSARAIVPPKKRVRAAGGGSGHQRPFILWTEWPTLAPGDWPKYFDKLLQFVTANCLNVKVSRLVMRVLHPEFQNERGDLWQVTTHSSFFQDFMRHLPPSIEVYFYPYMSASDRWKQQMQVRIPLEATFKFTKKWNDFLEGTGVPHRIAGIVLDKEEGSLFKDDLKHLERLKRIYSAPGHQQIRFGLAIGFDSAGMISSFPKGVDDVYLEMYDFYVEGSDPAVVVEAHTNGALNNPERFLNILDEHVWGPYIRKYREHRRIIFMWSMQNRLSNQCAFPLIQGTCGERAEMGTWTSEAFFEFMDLLAERHPIFSQRSHGLFQFNFTPRSWFECS